LVHPQPYRLGRHPTMLTACCETLAPHASPHERLIRAKLPTETKNTGRTMNNGCGKIAKHVMPMILRRYRDAAGLPQQQLADYGEASKGFISALEGGHSVPNVDMLITLARRPPRRTAGRRCGRNGKKKCRHSEDGLLGPASSRTAFTLSLQATLRTVTAKNRTTFSGKVLHPHGGNR
jgi:transcriptional regulator with XRE-family HTH domain